MAKVLIKNGLVINRGKSAVKDLLIENDRITKVDNNISDDTAKVVDASDKWVMPGIIDDQVHFRQPGLTHKANLYTESRAALAGGVTSYMEMPNTKPPAVTQTELAKKYVAAAGSSITNYSFYMGVTNDNLTEVLKTDPSQVCGVKIFMGSSTGNMLVDNEKALDDVFAQCKMLIATHCEDEETIRRNLEEHKALGRELTALDHPIIRSREGCYISSSKATALAKKHGTRLHVLHISTKDELDLFDNSIPLIDKKITSEACVHHMFFNTEDYKKLGNQIKCNPAIKDKSDQDAIFQAMLDDRIDVIATDHAPHLPIEKNKPYLEAPSGLPLIQHTLLIMMDFYHRGMISKERIVEKMCHNPAILFRVQDRGYLDEGAKADIVIVDPNKEHIIKKEDLFYKCQWSPLEGYSFKGAVQRVYVNGIQKYRSGKIINQSSGERLTFKV
jgi:dihydroorotase